MLCLMFESDRKGYLTVNGNPPSLEQLARMTGGTTEEVSRALSELEASGVFSRTEHGMIYSRRMVRDEHKRELCREAGKKGGNPTLKGSPKGGSKGGSKRKPTPSSSSSSSTSVSKTPLPPFPTKLDTPEFHAAWDKWLIYRRERKKPLTASTVESQLAQLEEFGASWAVDRIRKSITNGWQGLVFDDDQPPVGLFDEAAEAAKLHQQRQEAAELKEQAASPEEVRRLLRDPMHIFEGVEP